MVGWKMSSLFCVMLLHTTPFTQGKPLDTSESMGNSSLPKECYLPNVKSCRKANIDLSHLKTADSIELLDGLQMKLVLRDDEGAVFHGVHSPALEAVFTFDDSFVAGSLHTRQGAWHLEGDFWIQYDNKHKHEKLDIELPGEILPKKTESAAGNDYLDYGARDTTTVVDYSIMIWVTPEFKDSYESRAEMMVNIKNMIREANIGYENSQIPVRVKLHGVEMHPTLHEGENGITSLGEFSNSMKKEELLNCADSAALLVTSRFPWCGLAWGDKTSSCDSFSITAKGCIWDYTFGHELAHNFGVYHNREIVNNPIGDGYGYLIQGKDAKGKGYATITAYTRVGHGTYANYYSNPDVIFPDTNTPTGVKGKANAARIITLNRFAMASCGNEEPNGACFKGPICVSKAGRKCIFPFTYKGKEYNECTDVDAGQNFWCAISEHFDGTEADQRWDICPSNCITPQEP